MTIEAHRGFIAAVLPAATGLETETRMAQLDVVYPRIDAARSIVEDEAAIIDRELAALDSFERRLARLEPTASHEVAGTGGAAAVASVRGVDPDAVRSAYRETVLAMSHYEREYGEPLLEHVEAEFGANLRTVFASSSPIPPVQRALVRTAVEESIQLRRQFRRTLTDELDSLSTIEAELGDIERRFHELRFGGGGSGDGRTNALDDLHEMCETLAAERQRTIHRRPAPRISGIGDRSLVAYLYGVADHRFPALVEIADVASQIARAGPE